MQEKQASAERIGAHCTFGVGLRSLCLEMGLTRTFTVVPFSLQQKKLNAETI